MTLAKWVLGAFVGLSMAVACSAPRPPRFAHLEHLVKLECGDEGQPECLHCGSCHATSRTDGELVAPGYRQCSSCHDNPRQILARSRLPGPAPGEAIRFSHENHLQREGILGQCVKCHAGVVSDDPWAPATPSMATCLGCHQSEFDQNRCTDCHPSAELAVLKPVTFLRHDGSWIRRHGLVAAQSRQTCGTCHAERSCTDCHDLSQTLKLQGKYPEAIFREMPHRADFITRHAIEASDQAKCLSCHAPSSCDSCHTARGVSANAVGARNPHPIGWVGRDTSSRKFHGRAARRDLLQCAGCHDQGPQTNCIRCHRPGAPGGNPHPSGWESSQDRSSPMCRYCHE